MPPASPIDTRTMSAGTGKQRRSPRQAARRPQHLYRSPAPAPQAAAGRTLLLHSLGHSAGAWPPSRHTTSPGWQASGTASTRTSTAPSSCGVAAAARRRRCIGEWGAAACAGHDPICPGCSCQTAPRLSARSQVAMASQASVLPTVLPSTIWPSINPCIGGSAAACSPRCGRPQGSLPRSAPLPAWRASG